MSIKDLVPRLGRNRDNLPERRVSDDPFEDFHHRMNRMFDDFFSDMGLMPRHSRDAGTTALAAFSPRIDVSETDKAIKISAELPGMDEDNVSVELDDDSLTIRGERKEEKEDKGENWFHREQSYGSFTRVVSLPARVDGDKAKAKFKKGVLTVTVPKHPEDQVKRRTITIESD